MNIEEIRAKIPHGGLKEIARRCNLHYMTIVALFDGRNRPVSEKAKAKILTATAEYLQELKTQRARAEEILKAI